MKTLSALASASCSYLAEDFRDQVIASARNLSSIGERLKAYLEKLQAWESTKLEVYRLDLEDLAELEDYTYGEDVDTWVEKNPPPQVEKDVLIKSGKQTIEGLIQAGVAPIKLKKVQKIFAALVDTLQKKKVVLSVSNALTAFGDAVEEAAQGAPKKASTKVSTKAKVTHSQNEAVAPVDFDALRILRQGKDPEGLGTKAFYQAVAKWQGKVRLSDEEVAALTIMNSLKSVARRKAFDNANLGEYDPSNPIIKRLVSLGLVSIKGGKMIVPTDWLEIEVVLAPYKIPAGLI